MVLAIAWKIQVKALGGLTAAEKRRLIRIANDAKAQGGPSKNSTIHVKPGLRAGPRMARPRPMTCWCLKKGSNGTASAGARFLRSLGRSPGRRGPARASSDYSADTNSPAEGIRPMGSSAYRQPVIRCAIYTRKSSDEGLEQEFNSLDAQREACEAYVLSQKHEGWVCLPEMYDDGGISGATMERPALKRLLSDIEARRIDTVVVYKVDRLTRSLRDFAKIVDVFDTAGASFVSVTQAFNTTTSMGAPHPQHVAVLRPVPSVKSQASAFATRSPPQRRKVCGWVACHPWDTMLMTGS